MSSDTTPARRDGVTAAPAAERRARSFDNVAARYGLDLAKRGHLDGFGASQALWQGVQALGRLQSEAAQRALQAHAQALRQVRAARSLIDVAAAGAALAQAQADSALRGWSDLAELLARAGAEQWNAALAACAGADGVARAAADHWLDTAHHARPETLEAQTEHVVNAASASPLLWPAQEAMREAMSFGTRHWQDWWSATLPGPDEATRH